MSKEDPKDRNKDLRQRSIRSFAAFAVLATVGIGGWTLARHAPRQNNAPAPFRQALNWSGNLWHSLFDPQKMNQSPAPPHGKKPRFNGDLGLQSPIDLPHWQVEVFSDQNIHSHHMKLNMALIKALPKTETSTQLFCIEGWSDPLSYAGVKFSDFLRIYGIGTRSGNPWEPRISDSTQDLYRYVALMTPDKKYYVSIDMESMLHPQTLLAYEENGNPLTVANGAPLRLLIPVKYGIKSLKRIGVIYFSDTRPPDFWAERGYDWYAGL